MTFWIILMGMDQPDIFPPDPALSNDATGETPEKQSRNRVIILSIAAVVIVFFIALAISLQVNRKSSEQEEEASISPTSTNNQITESPTNSPILSPSENVTLAPSQNSNPNLKTHTSSNLGISFSYLAKQDLQNIREMYVFEKGNKICVTYEQTDTTCEVGQSVEVFTKSADESLEKAIQRQFLYGKDLNRCSVQVSQAPKYPTSFLKGEIMLPKYEDFDMEKMMVDTEYCSPDYAQTNGIRYFLEDANHPTKFFFFGIGQYAIFSENEIPWQETLILP